jgi:hypothetical protein
MGWRLWERYRLVFLKYNHKPDAATVVKLNLSRLWWHAADRVWFAAASQEAWLEAQTIACVSQTWESVGEDPPSPFDGMSFSELIDGDY